MRFEYRIENSYLRIWRTAVLCVATAALIAAVIAAAAAANGLLTIPPYPPAKVKPEERGGTLQQSVTLDRFKLAEARASLPWSSESASHSGSEFAYTDAVQRIARNLDDYVKSAFPPAVPVPEATQWSVKHVMKDLDLSGDAELRLYLGTLESLSAQLARTGPEQALLPEERRIDPHRVLAWHADRVQRTLRDLERENAQLQKVYQERLADYAHQQSRTRSYMGIAAAAVAVFVFAIFLFVIVRIERDLRTMAAASLATAKQLERA
ncbi:MAG: hypothetical protein ACT4PS_09555 [Betaproteobacteria bacterium]